VAAGETLNEAMIAGLRRIPTGGDYRFEPVPRVGPEDPTNPRDPTHDGVSRELTHRGEVVARAATDGATYCCGVTFEVWFEAAREAGALDDRGPEELRDLVASWFCPVMGHGGAATALIDAGLGVLVDPADARPGDLVQFWRSVDLSAPSGHSVVFLGWEGDAMRYWSSQPATGGVGEHSEVPGRDWQVHAARPLRR